VDDGKKSLVIYLAISTQYRPATDGHLATALLALMQIIALYRFGGLWRCSGAPTTAPMGACVTHSSDWRGDWGVMWKGGIAYLWTSRKLLFSFIMMQFTHQFEGLIPCWFVFQWNMFNTS